MKERVGSSARNGNGEGGTNDVHAMRRAYSVLAWDVQTSSVAVPLDMPYLTYFLKKAIVSGGAYPPVSNE